MGPKVSIIVPVYNSENYLQQCLESLRLQSLRNIEIVVVDDGSKDRSRQICEDYSSLDARFRVVRQSNMGVSAARNRGIAEASGEYIGFVDSDDVVVPVMYEVLSEFADKTGSDFVVCGIEVCDSDLHVRKALKVRHRSPDEALFIHNEVCMHSPCNKLIRRDIFTNNQIRFPEGVIMNEDLVAIIWAYISAKHVSFVDECFYKYREHSSSSVRTMSRRHVDSIEIATGMVDELITRYNLSNDFETFLQWRRLNAHLPYLLDRELRDFRKWRDSFVLPLAVIRGFPLSPDLRLAIVLLACHLDPIASILLRMRDTFLSARSRGKRK